ncbi:MAG: glycine oxidase ThiO [Deltaproteobacteria bacterium]|nr:glycine oxidase ThiO [Deltaproteobacteria bacterium]
MNPSRPHKPSPRLTRDTYPGTLVVGGGVIGLAVGWALALRGEPVTVLERGKAGREASWAAAGMLAPITEVAFQEDTNLALGLDSLARYPNFVARLQAATGLHVDFRTEGALQMALTADDSARLAEVYGYQRARGLAVEPLTPAQAQALEPGLSGYVAAAYLCRQDHQVDPRKLTAALGAALAQSGGQVLENTPVERFVLEPGKPPAVELGGNLAGEVWPARRVLLAAGAWSGLVAGLPDHLRPPVRPVKGQMLALRMPEPHPLTRFLRVVRVPEIYLAPKSDGRLIVGATVEEMGFDREVTAGGLYELLKGAWEALPGAYDLPVVETWTGFRPGSRDNAPILGESGFPGLYMATGHHRNGILTTPATAYHLSRLMLDGLASDLLNKFSPQRFNRPRAS